MKKEKLYLSIAGFIIELSFIKQEDSLNFINRFIALTRDFYKNFLIDYNSQSIDYRIKIIYDRVFFYIKKKKMIGFQKMQRRYL